MLLSTAMNKITSKAIQEKRSKDGGLRKADAYIWDKKGELGKEKKKPGAESEHEAVTRGDIPKGEIKVGKTRKWLLNSWHGDLSMSGFHRAVGTEHREEGLKQELRWKRVWKSLKGKQRIRAGLEVAWGQAGLRFPPHYKFIIGNRN